MVVAQILLISLIALLFIILVVLIIIITLPTENKNPCSTQEDCISGYVCDNDSICKLGLGLHCDETSNCFSSYVCLNNICAAPVVRTPTEKSIVSSFNTYTTTELTESTEVELEREGQNPIFEINSTDDEMNSCGTYDDIYFDVHSTSSGTAEDSDYFEKREAQIKQNDILDICVYSGMILSLTTNGNIICEFGNRVHTITNNVKLIQIVVFEGYVHGLSTNGILYYVPSPDNKNEHWFWKKTQLKDLVLTHISTTHDERHLWVVTQTNDRGDTKITKGLLYNSIYDNKLIREVNVMPDTRRIYGEDIHNYIELNTKTHTAVVYPSKQYLSGVYDAILAEENEVIILRKEELRTYSKIKFVNWIPYYIEA